MKKNRKLYYFWFLIVINKDRLFWRKLFILYFAQKQAIILAWNVSHVSIGYVGRILDNEKKKLKYFLFYFYFSYFPEQTIKSKYTQAQLQIDRDKPIQPCHRL